MVVNLDPTGPEEVKGPLKSMHNADGCECDSGMHTGGVMDLRINHYLGSIGDYMDRTARYWEVGSFVRRACRPCLRVCFPVPLHRPYHRTPTYEVLTPKDIAVPRRVVINTPVQKLLRSRSMGGTTVLARVHACLRLLVLLGFVGFSSCVSSFMRACCPHHFLLFLVIS